jgi:branched-chain amino acid transport system permease protein
VLAFACAVFMHRYFNSHLGRLATAIRDNELRVEYMGESVRRVIHLNYVISAALAGIGGVLMASAIGHVDPETTANWTISGEFVFITILGGTGSVFAPFFGATIFEAVRTYAVGALSQHLADGTRHRHAAGDDLPARRAVVRIPHPACRLRWPPFSKRGH